MRHELWGPEIHNHRISDQAAPLVSFILKYDLIIWNDKDSEPTFETVNGKSWIDITMSSANLANKKMNWQVIKNNFSDHNYLVFNVESFNVTRDPPRKFFNHRQILKICKAVHQKFLELQEEIQTIDSKQKLEKWIEELTITINQISQSFPRKVIKHLRVPWWDSELEVNRKKTRALRSRYQRCRREEERSMRRIVYKKQEAHYKWLIKQKCRASFELFCQQLVANNAFDLPYKIAAGKIRKQTVLQSVKTSNGQFTNTIEETIQTIVQALFPTDDSTQETHVQRKKRETVNTYSSTILDKQFTKQEITYAISTMKKKKAPGIDGISIEIIKELHDMNPDILHYTYNKCLELGIFPETWKKGKLIIFNKPGKDPSLPNAYRPICLLSVLGKILDKLLVFRITHSLHINNKLHKQQHGFRNGRSCETANFRLWQAINIALQERVPATILSLDVQGAFDTVWRTSILFQLTQANCPQNIFNLVRNYFTNRSIHYFQDEEVWNFDNQRGVPQGSCSGPLFWNLVMDTALDLPLPQGSHIQAYADDIIVVIRGKNKEEIERKGNAILEKLLAWGVEHKLSFNMQKTIQMPITFGGRLNLRNPPIISIKNHTIQVVNNIKYLGVTWDCCLTFTKHFKALRDKTDSLTYKLSTVANEFYSKRSGLFRKIYFGAIEPYLLFGVGAWGNRLKLKKIRDSLNSLQRRPLIKITKAYRTISTEALQVIVGIVPLDIKAKGVFGKFLLTTINNDIKFGSKIFKWEDYETRLDPHNIHPADNISISYDKHKPSGDEIEIYTDGSKINDQVGAAIVVFYYNAEIFNRTIRLSDFATVYQAEVTGIQMALEFIYTIGPWNKINLYTDSLSVLEALNTFKTSKQEILAIKNDILEMSKEKSITLHWIPA
ncbi:Putative protein in type-1 retrotransposable element R1DM, partial [Araneus ventricosus]